MRSQQMWGNAVRLRHLAVILGSLLTLVLIPVVINYATENPLPEPLRIVQTHPWPVLGILFLLALVYTSTQSTSGARDRRLILQHPLRKGTREHALDHVTKRLDALTRDIGSLSVQIELELTAAPSAVRPNLDHFVDVAPLDGPREAGADIVDLFDQADRSLLILGEPGAGKTTLQRRLAMRLLERAQQDAGAPVPLLLPLRTWRPAPDGPAPGGLRILFGPPRFANLEDWLVFAAREQYGIREDTCRRWLAEAAVALLLDGLDEVDPDEQDALISQINDFVAEYHALDITVTSRSRAYTQARHELTLLNAVAIEPLTREKVLAFLDHAGPELEPMRTAVLADENLLDMLTAPLWLWMLQQIPALPNTVDGDAREQLLEHYLHTALTQLEQRRGIPIARARIWLSSVSRFVQAAERAGRGQTHNHNDIWAGALSPEFRLTIARSVVPLLLLPAITVLIAVLGHQAGWAVACVLGVIVLVFPTAAISDALAAAEGHAVRPTAKLYGLTLTSSTGFVLFALGIGAILWSGVDSLSSWGAAVLTCGPTILGILPLLFRRRTWHGSSVRPVLMMTTTALMAVWIAFTGDLVLVTALTTGAFAGFLVVETTHPFLVNSAHEQGQSGHRESPSGLQVGARILSMGAALLFFLLIPVLARPLVQQMLIETSFPIVTPLLGTAIMGFFALRRARRHGAHGRSVVQDAFAAAFAFFLVFLGSLLLVDWLGLPLPSTTEGLAALILMFGLYHGAVTGLAHLAIFRPGPLSGRGYLWAVGLLPVDLDRFLGDLADVGLLQGRPGTFQFVHEVVLEHIWREHHERTTR